MTAALHRIEGGRRVQPDTPDRPAPGITIVTVVFNARALLAKSLQSVLTLQRDDVAYIVVDGASTDGTVDDLHAIGCRLEYWMSERDRGIYNAMNKAIGLAAPGSFILFLGAGDTILRLPDADTLSAAQAVGTHVLYGDVMIGEKMFRSSFNKKLQYRNTLHHQGLFVRRDALSEPWFDESFKVFSDWNLNLQLFTSGATALRLGYTVAYAEPGGVSAKLHLREIARLVAKQCGLFSAFGAVVYHSSLHFVRYYAGFLSNSRK
jgi:glycosyltransferase involved in cell wall biosynthesis